MTGLCGQEWYAYLSHKGESYNFLILGFNAYRSVRARDGAITS
jgi:hypothetical protein